MATFFSVMDNVFSLKQRTHWDRKETVRGMQTYNGKLTFIETKKITHIKAKGVETWIFKLKNQLKCVAHSNTKWLNGEFKLCPFKSLWNFQECCLFQMNRVCESRTFSQTALLVFHWEKQVIWNRNKTRATMYIKLLKKLAWAGCFSRKWVMTVLAVKRSQSQCVWTRRITKYSLPPSGTVSFHFGPVWLHCGSSLPPPFSQHAPAPTPPASRSHLSARYECKMRKTVLETKTKYEWNLNSLPILPDDCNYVNT